MDVKALSPVHVECAVGSDPLPEGGRCGEPTPQAESLEACRQSQQLALVSEGCDDSNL